MSDATLSGAERGGDPGWLSLAAAPVFALMALWTAGSGGHAICAATPGPISDMTLMYLLMSALHLAPWLRLVRWWAG